MKEISYKLALPQGVIKSSRAWGVVIPREEVNFTVISGCMPMLLKVNQGMISILDDTGQATDKFFVRGGIADIKDDECVITTESIIGFDDVSYDEASLKAAEDDFYQMIAAHKAK
ncbi:MAG: hypothetical protein IJ689_03175 [Alphaproteobacteria bacterium]|nr:hypothetical protein [Alphaproteobacteria bacterium]